MATQTIIVSVMEHTDVDWLEQEMEARPLGLRFPQHEESNYASPPAEDDIRLRPLPAIPIDEESSF